MTKTKPFRVALATDSLNPSGVGEHMLTLSRELVASHDVVLCFPGSVAGRSFLSRAAYVGFCVKELEEDEPATAGWLRRAGIDLMHVHAGIGWEGNALARAGHAAGIPVVRTEHLPYLITDPKQGDIYREALAVVDRVIAVSDAAADSFRRVGVAAHKLSTIRNGIHAPEPTSSREQIRADLGVAQSDLFVLTVARFTPQKGHSLLLAAMNEVTTSVPSARLFLAGDGHERAAMQRVAAELGLIDRVFFLGERDDVANLLAAADLFVSPSLFEGLPLAVLEAMALAVPVVATRIGGTTEALGEGHPWYAQPHDVDGMVAVVRDALTHEVARRQIGSRGKVRFEAYYQASRMAQQTASLYRQILHAPVPEIEKSKHMQKTRICFIGAGGIAQRHLSILENFDDVELAAFADIDFGRAEVAARRHGAQAFENHAEMLDSTRPDAVFICIPPYAHGAPEQDVLSRCLPFFVEKPLSLDLGLSQRIAQEIACKRLVTAVGYHWRYLDTVEEARHLLADNPAQLLCGFWLDQTPPPQWWWRKDRSGGQMIEQATHIVDLARYLAGDVSKVYGMAGHRARPDFEHLDVATASTASLRFAAGAIADISATCLLRWGHRIGLHIFADGLAIELTDHDIMVDVGAGRPVRRAERDPVWYQDRDFVDAVRGGENRIRCPYQEALETHRVAVAIARSAETGMPISLESNLFEAVNNG
jgi:predicted dehydrogenase/glycosyltransferase involved in cell wall biosynthesis